MPTFRLTNLIELSLNELRNRYHDKYKNVSLETMK